MKNQTIREEAKKAGVHLWELADLFNVTDSYFSRKLRRELNDDDKKRCLDYLENRKRKKGDVSE